MNKNYFVFKLNVQPNTIVSFKKENQFEYLISTLIPTVLDHVIGIKQKEGFKETVYELIPELNNEVEFNKKFLKLEEESNKLYKLYKEISLKYKEEGEIFVFCKRKVQRIATKNTECCHPIFSYFLDNAFVKRKLWPV